MKTNKNKILFIVQLPPPVHGTSVMNEYIKNSEVINSNFVTSFLPLNFVNKIDEIGKFSVFKVFKMIGFCITLIIRLFKFKPNLVYYTLAPHGFAFYRDFLFVFIIKFFRTKIVFHLHGKGIDEEVKNSIKCRLYKIIFKNVNVITLSKLLDYDISSVYKGEIYNLANGIQINRSLFVKKETKNIELIYLSNLIKSKGVLDLIKALDYLKTDQLDYSLNIIGNSGDISIIELKDEIKSLKLDSKINVLGPKYGDEKWELLYNSDIFIFPTFFKNECFPLVILEAMQASTAIISTNNGAISEIIEECGITVPQKNPEKLAEVIKELVLDKEKAEQLKGKAEEEFNKKYSLVRFENNLINILNQIFKNKSINEK